MASKILSFICHVPGVVDGGYSVAVATGSAPQARTAADAHVGPGAPGGGHFTAIYENEKFVRFKYIHHE